MVRTSLDSSLARKVYRWKPWSGPTIVALQNRMNPRGCGQHRLEVNDLLRTDVEPQALDRGILVVREPSEGDMRLFER